MPASSVIADLRARLARIEGGAAWHGLLPFGFAAIDQRLPGAGLATGALHEISGSPDLADDDSATIFLAGIAARLPGPYDLVIQVVIVRPGPIQGEMVHPYRRCYNAKRRSRVRR
ncbi:hypothetical protein [Sphingobium sp. SCG-1]|uniref:hypothetical protein n=1 Tax=Sphingobium sp. SCG-1 TaxID=2072936 RepID=UPI0011AB6CEE|nr:hypothetical protein [Sphingobium sp. SCG-1]